MPANCKDCPDDPPSGGRPRLAPYPGPRCFSHHKQILKSRKEAARVLRLEKTYGLKPGQYEELYAAQGGFCAICKRARGLTKKLAVDHDHETGYVRGLLCGPCNKILGHLRDSLDLANGLYQYLARPPAYKVIGMVKPDGE